MVGQTVSTVWQKKKRNSVTQLDYLWTKFYIVTIQITPLQQTVHSSGACLSILLQDEIWDFLSWFLVAMEVKSIEWAQHRHNDIMYCYTCL